MFTLGGTTTPAWVGIPSRTQFYAECATFSQQVNVQLCYQICFVIALKVFKHCFVALLLNNKKRVLSGFWHCFVKHQTSVCLPTNYYFFHFHFPILEIAQALCTLKKSAFWVIINK